MQSRKRRGNEGGFTLVELAVVVVIIGVLAAFAVPKFLSSVERSKAAEAFTYLSTVRSAQERYHAKHGLYAAKLSDLDVTLPALEYFTTKGITKSNAKTLQTKWSQTLTRSGSSAGYGAYTVIYTQDGFDPKKSTISKHPKINPMKK